MSAAAEIEGAAFCTGPGCWVCAFVQACPLHVPPVGEFRFIEAAIAARDPGNGCVVTLEPVHHSAAVLAPVKAFWHAAW